jgi:hypothetical protein
MRILFLHHFPERESVAGRLLLRWAEALAGEGHEVRLLVVDASRGGDESLPVDRVICDPLDPAADLKLDLPRFSQASVSGESTRFHQLTDEQLNAYRDVLRRRMDAHIDRFDPHVLHADHAWVLGQLALESGVPYVLNAWGEELVDARLDARYFPLAEQAAANAGRILVPDQQTLAEVERTFETEPGRIVVASAGLASDAPADAAAAANELAALYQALLEERFGRTS